MKGVVLVLNIVEMDWLKDHINDENVRIIDCRFSLTDPTEGLNNYLQSHIQNALFFDLEKDLSSEVEVYGGRHPLPRILELVDKLGAAGIDKDIKIIAYDDQGGAIASRFWWLLQYLGHKETYILNGGYTKWKESKFPISDKIPIFERRNFSYQLQEEMIIEAKEILEKLDDKDVLLLDSRELQRYQGVEEPIDPVAGRIPGAKHYFWKNNINLFGIWKGKQQLSKQFHEFHDKKEIIVYCGSGVTACPNVIALKEAGFKNVKLYLGSWSDWITQENYPIEKD